MDSPETGPQFNCAPGVMISRCLACLLLLLSAACQPLTATVQPTPEIVQIQYTPALSSWTAALNRCASSLPQIGLVTSEMPANQLDPSRVDFALHFGPQIDPVQSTPLPFFASVLSSDEIVLAVDAANPVASLTPPMINAIFSGPVTLWNDLTIQKATSQPTEVSLAIQVWSYPPGDDVRQVFDKAFLQGTSPASQTYLAPDAGVMLEALT